MRSLFITKKSTNQVSVKDAIELLVNNPSAENRIKLYRSLKEGTLFIAARQVPKEWESGPVTLENVTIVTVLTSISPDGGEALLAFTSSEEVKKRSENSASFSMKTTDILKLIIEKNFSALIINPGGAWASVPIEDVERILEGVW